MTEQRQYPIILIDTREQLPFTFQGYNTATMVSTIHTGDYSIAIKVIRKSREKLMEYIEKTYGIAYTLNNEVVQEDGKYTTIIKFDKEISIERKSIEDFTSVLTDNRDRFEASVQRGSSMRYYAIFLECSEMDIIGHKYISKILPQSVLNTAIRWSVKYRVPIVFCGDRINAEYHIYNSLICFLDYKKRGLL